MQNSMEESSSEGEGDRTMVANDTAIADLQHQIHELQLSLEASEKERLCLKKTLETTTAAAQATINYSLADSVQVTTTAPVTSMYAYTSLAAALPLYSMPHTSFANTCSYNDQNTKITSADIFSAHSYANTGFPYALNINHQPHINVQHNASQFNRPNVNQSTLYSYNAVSTDSNNNAATGALFNATHSSRTPNTNSQIYMQPYSQPFVRKIQDLPQFSGSPEEWPMFIVAYKETTNLFSYTDVENLLRLQKALKGDARAKVESLLIHPSSVNAAISSLEFHFGRPEVLIRSQLTKARSFPLITSGKIHEIANFSSMVTNLVAFLENAGAAPHLSNPTLLDELVSKLPLYKREEWVRHTFSINKPYPTIREFSTWLQQISMYIVMAAEVNQPPVNTEQLTQKSNRSSKTVMAISEEQLKCILCKENHKLYQCTNFKDVDSEKRWDIVKSNKLCFCCLSTGHSVYNCTRRRACGISSCQKYHNKLLHSQNVRTSQTGSTVPIETAVATVSTCQSLTNSKNVSYTCRQNVNKTLLKFLPVKLHGPKGNIEVMAFIDEGAKVTLLEEQIADKIGLAGGKELLHLKWFDNQTTSEVSKRVELEISSACDKKRKFLMKGVRTVKKLLLQPQTLCAESFKKHNKELSEIPIQSYTDAIPKILIGVPHTNLVRPLQVVNFNEGFTAHETKLGWIVFGSDENGSDLATICHVHIDETIMNELQKQVAEYFALEKFEKELPPIKSASDIRADHILRNTTKFVGDRYETGLLWQNDEVILPDSYEAALKRLQSVERKMLADINYEQWYINKINEYVKKGYARKLTIIEAKLSAERVWYLPHFAVYNVNKGNKPRLVFDAAATVCHVSLNSKLMKGPDEYQPKPLQSILFKFREGKVAICGDIREMFHRINIRKQDQHSQRFLWRDGNMSKQPDVYVMRAMIFGSVCSPCSAQFIKNLNALKFKDEYPRAVEAIVNRHYVDDYVDSFSNIDEAISVSKRVVDIHKIAGFELRGFVSNSTQLLRAMNESSEHECATKNMSSNESTCEKVLGMHWDAKRDVFYFNLTFARIPKPVLDGSRRPTKAELLGLTMSIFDPFGLVANVTLIPKILLQRLWKLNTGWHEAIPEDVYEKWYGWYKMLDELKQFQTPRCYSQYFTDPSTEIELHIFVDASELAYAAVAYFRICYNNDVNVAFVVAKSRCSPLKPMSIPRLELQAAVLGTRLSKVIVEGHTVRPKTVHYWSDSKTVIQWIRSEARKYKQFVCNRIAEILDTTDVAQWRWVPGSLNPADDATRPQSCNMFSTNTRWLNGPAFLKQSKDNWPLLQDIPKNSNDKEERTKQLYSIQMEESIIPFTRFSNYYKFLKIMTWVRYAVLRFLALKNKVGELPKIPLKVTANEIGATEALLVRLIQEAEFTDEVKALRSGSQVSKRSQLWKLTPILDDKGLLRLGGRIDNATCLPVCTRNPVILPKENVMSRLIVRHFHEIFYHQNTEAIMCAIRAKYWIPNVRSLLKTVKRKCQFCRNAAATPSPPLMGQIPADRLEPYVRPFTYAGVDYFGPVMVSIGRRREKRWVALFTCMTVRAIHLELARDLSSDSVILCLRNFVNRRGAPVRIRSDRGTNFVGASKIEWLHVARDIEGECTRRGIEWVFNTPGHPSAGGAWERMVRSVKRVLAFTVKEVAPQIETLQSLLIEAENLINSRPLTHLSIESIEAGPLTPNHFLLGCPSYIQTPTKFDTVCLRKQWRILQRLKQTFWRRWILEYLPSLTRRTKWHQRVDPIKVGDVVIVCDSDGNLGEWRRGIVLEVFPAPDGQVRSALIKTSSGNLKRPASKLAVLDVYGESQAADATSIHGGRDVADVRT